MRLVCPSCGAIASAEAWQNDPAARQMLDIIAKLPGPVAIRALPYFGLFRKGKKRVLAWPTALTLATELQQLVAQGTIQWDGGEERPTPPALWARIMDQMIAAHKEGLHDHNYLRKAVWSEARTLAAGAESAGQTRAQHRLDEPEPFAPAGPKKKSCYTCLHQRRPQGCKKGKKPAAGNMNLGCKDGWEERAASIGEVAEQMTSNLHSTETVEK